MTFTPLKLFEGFGVELEYMIVDRTSLNPLPISDRILLNEHGQIESEIEIDEDIAISNELVAHVIELKTNGPKPALESLSFFQKQVREINRTLKEYNACLLPTAMHPWLKPDEKIELWKHEYNAVYESFNRIFNCQGHGWSNLQSTHLNLAFSNDEEFQLLHEAIRYLLPILPAICASSPVNEGKITGFYDYRLEVYEKNCAKIPSLTGDIIPESVSGREEYEAKILNKIYSDIRPYDPEGILQYEWLNARGAITRFDRMAIEIRTIDIQECPRADLSILRSVEILLRHIIDKMKNENWDGEISQKQLYALLKQCIHYGPYAPIDSSYSDYLSLFGVENVNFVKDLLEVVFESLVFKNIEKPEIKEAINFIITKGPLSERIIKSQKSGLGLVEIYQQLRDCLDKDQMFKC